MQKINTILIKDDDLSFAAQTLKSGGLTGVPTETVYGLAANGFDEAAVERIYEVKGRPETKPLSLLVSGIDMAASVCAQFPPAAQILAEAFWPGPLTIVLPCSNKVPQIVTAGGNTVGVRCPKHEKTLKLLELAGVPAAAPSANPSGQPSPKSADDVMRYFDGMIECVIDGGVCSIGTESTIVSLAGFDKTGQFEILRPGALGISDIRNVLSCIS